MIDTATETMLTLAQASRETPSRSGRRGVDVSTVWRWCTRGIHGARLETLLIGGIRYTSREALQRFFAAATAAADGATSTPPNTPAAREQAIARAEAELAKL